MPEELRQIFPSPPPAAEIFATHQLAYEFRRETEYRQRFAEYCEWYRHTAQIHQQELKSMRKDLPILGWFLGSKR
ncbi:MAG: hypothetical protein SAJ37_12320 [Oscillatoria sp. PMC 1068.18]|nr:hypothetical protein [Oscillatoria sp. PMC 1076.18]MEC4989527.1 hypothetical protein [Oscillatoria sp. PMC 1068.18]